MFFNPLIQALFVSIRDCSRIVIHHLSFELPLVLVDTADRPGRAWFSCRHLHRVCRRPRLKHTGYPFGPPGPLGVTKSKIFQTRGE